MKELFDGKGINSEELPDGFVAVLDTTGLKLSNGRVHDSQRAESLVREVIKKVNKGYDSHCFFNFLVRYEIGADILVRKGSKVRGDNRRDDVVRRIRRVGVNGYKKEIGYGLRNLVESVFSVFKRWFGEYVMSRKPQNIAYELEFCDEK